MDEFCQEDFDVVAQSYRVVSDADAFDDLVEAWQQRLARNDSSSAQEDVFARHLLRHVEKADKLVTDVPGGMVVDPVDKLLSDTSCATLVVSAEKYVLGTNMHWGALFGHAQGQKIGEDWLASESVEAFRSILRNLKTRGNLQHGIVRICTSEMEDRIAEIFPVDARAGQEPHAVAVRVLDPEWTPSVKAGIIEAFGLTEAEAEICRALFRLRDTAAIAEERNTSTRTVRLQLTSVFNKMGASSQVDLVRLLALICVRMSKASENEIPVWQDPYRRERTFKTSTGRKLAYSWLGARNGTPVVLLHGNSVGVTLPEEADRFYRKMGVRLITFSRPGFGHSEPRHELSVIDDTIDALNELHAHLDVGALHFMAHTFTGLALARFGTLYPQKLASIISVGGFFPMNDRKRRKHLPLIHNTFLDLAARAPWACRMLAKAGQRIMREKGIDWYLNRAYGHSEQDLRVINHPVYRAILRNASAHGLSQGAETFAREFEFCHYDGFPELSRLKCPVHLAVGDCDPQMTKARIDEFCQVQPSTQLTILPDCGELIVYTGWREIAGIVESLVKEPALA
ncbi:alpha/beta fold hydrolase [Ponticaulis sp.]|uniref:alpha/beta fold hydrolase n=1 Tax=Ponticaulis sp. TaxID=2020902 RepID=UPI0025E5098C|nr:alpha/beta fold hydrolase [Ponticaulis sp.]